MIKKIYKISFLAALLGSFSFFVGCDEASEPKTAAQESSEHPGSQGDSFVSSESNKSVTLTVDVQDKKEEGFQLLASADSFLVKILCDSGSQYVGQKNKYIHSSNGRYLLIRA